MTASAIWQTIGGIIGLLGVIGVLARISYQLGSLVQEFRAYVKLNDRIVSDLAARVDRLEVPRRR